MTEVEEVPADKIRNVVLVGHGGTGKTTIAEAMLAAGGVTSGRGGTLDFEPEERDRGHSLGLAVGSLMWRDHRVNLLDCPGAVEAAGDAYPALLAAETAVFVVDATLGVQPQHEQLWAVCEQLNLPRLVMLNKLDKRNATFQANVDALRERYGRALAPVQMPIGVEEDFSGIIDLLHSRAVVRQDDQRVECDIPEDRVEQAKRNRDLLVEAIVENDDELLERYLEGETPEVSELAAVFAKGIASCGFFPVLCGSATEQLGTRMLLDFLVQACPSPADRSVAEVPLDGPSALYVAKTLSDPYVGRINVLRVLSGGLRQDDGLVNQRTGATVRLHGLVRLVGKEQDPVGRVGPGDLVAVTKLDDVGTGDVLSEPSAEIKLPVVAPPEPHYRVALQPASSRDEDKLSPALARLAEEDPVLRVERDPETAQLVLYCYGPSHVEVTLGRMERKFNVTVERVPLRLRYRETLRGPGKGKGRHVKQSGGHGQYGIAEIEVEPLPPGGGFEFEDRIVGGAIPNQYIGSVEKGIREAMAQGILAGYPVVDVRARLFDGKFHSVDSSDMAFQMAGLLAFRDAAEKAGMVLLEPVLDVRVTAPDLYMGDILGDLSGRRGRIKGTEQSRPGWTTVNAFVPESEMLTYVAELRSITSGAGMVEMTYDHHQEVPEALARKLIDQAQQRAEERRLA